MNVVAFKSRDDLQGRFATWLQSVQVFRPARERLGIIPQEEGHLARSGQDTVFARADHGDAPRLALLRRLVYNTE